MKTSIRGVVAGIGMMLVSTSAFAASPLHLWSFGLGDSDYDQAGAVAVDASGNVIVTGGFDGTVDFGTGGIASNGERDVYVVQYSPNGTVNWVNTFGGADADIGYDVAVDAAGNVIVVGAYQGTVDFGAGNHVSAGEVDLYIVKYSSSGVHQWSACYGSTLYDYALGVDVDASGNVYVTGGFFGTVSFGGASLVSAGDSEIFLAKYSPNGAHQWSQRFGASTADEAKAIAVDDAGNIVITGNYYGTVDFGGGGLTTNGGNDMFLARYNTAGAHQWSKRFGSIASDVGFAVAIDPFDNILLAGQFEGSVDFGGNILVGLGNYEGVVAKYNSAGVHQWSQRFGNTGFDAPRDIATDDAGNVAMTGYFQVSADFGGGPLISAGDTDIFIAHYDSAGTHQWSLNAGSTSSDNGDGIAMTPSGDIIATGVFQSSADLGGGAIPSNGNTDIYIAYFGAGAADPAVSSIVDVPNDNGRAVEITIARSGYDHVAAADPVLAYEIYRRDDAAPALTGTVLDRPVFSETQAHRADGWTYVGSTPAHGEETYSVEAPTIGDSTITSGQYYSVFFVRAATSIPTTFYDTAPDSGYSLDNLSPATPSNLVHSSGLLSWDESGANDFEYFTVYGSHSAEFSSAVVMSYPTSPSMDVTASPYGYFFVTATDYAGNESVAADLNIATGTAGTPASYILSVSNYPNPFNPATTVRFTVPTRGHVTVSVFDARGMLTRTLVANAIHDAGVHQQTWDGRSDHGVAVASGIYFVKIEHGGTALSRKMVLLK